MWRIVLGCLVGMSTSVFAVGLSVGTLTYFDVGPIGQFINHVIPQAMAKQSLNDYSLEIMRQGLIFGWLVIFPLSSLIGSLVGTTISSTRGTWVGLTAVVPMVAIAFSGKSDGILRVLSALLCLAVGGGTGYIVERLLKRKQKTTGE